MENRVGRLVIPYSGTTFPNMGMQSSASSSVVRRGKGDRGVSALADALFTSTQQRVLALLFGQPRRDFFVTEIIDLVGLGRGTVQRELARLAESGLAVVTYAGNRKYYRANRDSPLFDEICGIVRKTVGIEESVRDALQPLADGLVLALLYGSIARGTDTAASDVDLLLVSDELTLEAAHAALAPVEELLGRRMNPTIYTTDEYRRRRAAKSGFLTQLLQGRVVVLVGNLDAE